MELYSAFEERGYVVQAFLPSSMKEGADWLVTVYKGKEFVRAMRVPLSVPPFFEVDNADKATLEEKTEELMQSLP